MCGAKKNVLLSIPLSLRFGYVLASHTHIHMNLFILVYTTHTEHLLLM